MRCVGMDIKDLLKYERKKFQELSAGINKTDLDWLTEIFLKKNPELGDYGSDSEKERKFLSRFNSFLYPVHHDKPANIRAYVEEMLKKQDYDKRLGELSNGVFSIKPGDAKACNDLERKINQLLDEAEKEFPGFTKARALMISEISGDIIAVKSKGSAGSTRMLKRMHEQKPEKKRQRTGASP